MELEPKVQEGDHAKWESDNFLLEDVIEEADKDPTHSEARA